MLYDGNVYVSYVINKPLTIKGVDNNGRNPKIYGTFKCELIDSEYKENSVTIDNLDIIHGYVGGENREINSGFMNAIEVSSGSANIVNNNI